MRDSLVQVYVHLVWGTWDRLPLVGSSVERRLYRCMYDRFHEFKCPVYALNGVEDHVHALIGLHPNVAVAPLVKDVKGASSHFASHELLSDGFFKWQGAYGAFSIEHKSVPRIIAYIRNQKDHHARGDVDTELEDFLTYKDLPADDSTDGERNRAQTHSVSVD